jgi:hypothetical protein
VTDPDLLRPCALSAGRAELICEEVIIERGTKNQGEGVGGRREGHGQCGEGSRTNKQHRQPHEASRGRGVESGHSNRVQTVFEYYSLDQEVASLVRRGVICLEKRVPRHCQMATFEIFDPNPALDRISLAWIVRQR